MARFNGVKQGVGVWLWAIIVAVVVAVLSAIAGAQVNVVGSLNGFPRLPINEGQMTTTGGIIVAILVVAMALFGAVLGGLAGMRFHRRVDSATHDGGLGGVSHSPQAGEVIDARRRGTGTR
jgi:hypothetical protein